MGLVVMNSSADHRGSWVTPPLTLPSAGLFWSLGFVYASLMALLLQKVILPLMPELHAGHGLLPNDAIAFHNLAVDVAARIQTHGWSEWSIFPPGATGNVGLLGALYALFGPDPAWFIPFNAAAHAAGALLLYRLGFQLWPGLPGRLGGLIAGIAFLVFPSALQWYGQNHKDAFAIVGTLLVLDAWLHSLSRTEIPMRRLVLLLIQVAAGGVLIGLVRPYYVVLLQVGLSAAWLVDLVAGSLSRRSFSWRGLSRQILLWSAMAVVTIFFARHDTVGVFYRAESPAAPTTTYANQHGWTWRISENIPHQLEKTLRRASELRKHFVDYGRQVGAGSGIDGDRLPDDAWSAMAYLPRALFVGLMAPFPDTWGERVTAFRLIGAMETALWYLFALGVVLLVWRRPSRELLAGVVFCSTLLAILSYVHPNVGTLYRQRYGLWHFFLLCGSVGWFSLMADYLRKRQNLWALQTADQNAREDATDKTGGRASVDKLASAGFVVILITLVSYLGFFARDLLMIRQLGITEELDAFFTAAMIPMFFVTCLAMPMADALTPTFLAMQKEGVASAAKMLRHQLGFAVLFLGGAVLLILLFSPQLMGGVLGGTDSVKLASSSLMLRWFAPILLLSAWTVVGNAALNALGRQRDAALGQLFVPAITIGLLVFMPASEALIAAIAGMLSGTLLNGLWVRRCLMCQGIRFTPALPEMAVLKPFMDQYRRLLLAAMLPALLVPLNYAFAASVDAGGVSVWAFASKISVLFSSLATVVALAVVLPHFSRLLAGNQHHNMRQDANLLLVLSTWVGGLFLVSGFIFAEPLVGATFSGTITDDQLAGLANIVKVSIIQLPLAIQWALVAKMAIVSGNSPRVLYATLHGFAANLLVNLWLVPQLGVLGVALGSLAAGIVSTLLLFLTSYRRAGLLLCDMLLVLGGWGTWVVVFVALASRSNAALTSSITALAGLAVGQYLLLNARAEGRP